ncbi:hypothetical protein SAMN05216344_11069 [Polaromonas sp. OV174]|nr:hypothetical protein SAMN05216344_11069 [Polaromonas sp. OV174]
MAIRDFEFPDRRGQKFHPWEEVEKYVMKEIAKGNAELPWPMARKLGICEKQFCLRLPEASKALRAAVLSKEFFAAECEYLKKG